MGGGRAAPCKFGDDALCFGGATEDLRPSRAASSKRGDDISDAFISYKLIHFTNPTILR